jgi:hypothetical protein
MLLPRFGDVLPVTRTGAIDVQGNGHLAGGVLEVCGRSWERMFRGAKVRRLCNGRSLLVVGPERE